MSAEVVGVGGVGSWEGTGYFGGVEIGWDTEDFLLKKSILKWIGIKKIKLRVRLQFYTRNSFINESEKKKKSTKSEIAFKKYILW